MPPYLLKTWDTDSSSHLNLKAETTEYMGHYCWKCGQYLANEKFSGKGHARHILFNRTIKIELTSPGRESL